MSNGQRLYGTIYPELVQVWQHLRRELMETLIWMVVGIYVRKKVFLSKIAKVRTGRANPQSKTRQLRRWVDNAQVSVRRCWAPFARGVLAAAAAGGRVRLLIDTLELSGQRQILMVALAYRGRALPILWWVRRRKGVHSARQQIGLLKKVRAWIPRGAQVVLMGDGEFHSVELMRWLQSKGWHYRLRLPGDTCVQREDGSWVQLQQMGLQPGERRYLNGVRLTKEHAWGPVGLALEWARGEDAPWFIVTDQQADAHTLRDYSRRMWIEALFGDLQENGFHLHHTRLYQSQRLARLLVPVCVAYLWLVCLGAWIIKRGWRRQIDRPDRRDLSLFQLGLEWLEHCLAQNLPLSARFQPILS